MAFKQVGGKLLQVLCTGTFAISREDAHFCLRLPMSRLSAYRLLFQPLHRKTRGSMKEPSILIYSEVRTCLYIRTVLNAPSIGWFLELSILSVDFGCCIAACLSE